MKRLLGASVAACALTLSFAPSQAATIPLGGTAVLATPYGYQADAYGTKVTLGHVVTSGPSAPVVVGCGATPGIHKTNTTAGVDASPLLHTGTINTTADTFASPAESSATARVQGLSLLSGVVTANVVRSASSTSHNGAGFHTSAAGTSFTSLVIAGIPITGVIDPNTRIDVPGFGYVVLNEQIGKITGRSAELTVNAIHLVITDDNALGIPVGTTVIVAHASTGLGGPAVATLDGFAYGSKAKVGDVISSGASFRVRMPCLGTNGRVKTNDGAGISLPGVLETGAIHNTAQGTVDADNASGETTSTVDNAAVVGSLVQATVIKADAHASTDGTNATFSDAGSIFATLSIQGFPEIGPDVPANTHLHIAGLGTLWLHRVITRSDSIEVRMIELIVKHDNSLGLPIGSDVQVAVAHASAH